MLIRILADNPGASFTKNLEKQFTDTVKHLLRNGRDPSVSQILRETLDSIHRDKAYDTNLNTLFAMWAKEKKLMADAAKHVPRGVSMAPRWPDPNLPQGFNSGHRGGGLPPPVELVARIEEARTSAKLLLQLVQSTPASELLGNDLVKEFAERCTSAQRSVQTYINCDNPPPDDDTMLTLIETNEQLSLAASKHQRAVLQARRAIGASPSPPVPGPTFNNTNYSALPPAPVPVPAPATTYSPPPAAQSEIPILPPLGLESNEPKANKAASYKKDELPLPPALQAGPGRPRSSSNSAQEAKDNPFADHHTYSAPPAPAPGQSGESRPANGYTGYGQGYQATPSYLGRQESAANNVTMHGAAKSKPTEEEEYARDYAGGNRPRTPEEPHQRHGSDVSPITDRGTVTYRY